MRMRGVALALLCLGSSWLAGQELLPGTTIAATGVRAIDGDSLRVRIAGTEIELRLWGIDAPEKGQPGADEAQQALATLTVDRPLTAFVVEVDRFKRPIVRLRSGAIDVNLRLIEAGWAWWFRRFAPAMPAYGEAERKARAARRGLWRDPAPEAPWDFRDRQTAQDAR